MTPRTELDRLFADSLAKIPTPESPMYYESPDLGHEAQERDTGVIDFNEVTAGDRATVANIREWKKNRDRNATPRTVFTDGDAA